MLKIVTPEYLYATVNLDIKLYALYDAKIIFYNNYYYIDGLC